MDGADTRVVDGRTVPVPGVPEVVLVGREVGIQLDIEADLQLPEAG